MDKPYFIFFSFYMLHSMSNTKVKTTIKKCKTMYPECTLISPSVSKDQDISNIRTRYLYVRIVCKIQHNGIERMKYNQRYLSSNSGCPLTSCYIVPFLKGVDSIWITRSFFELNTVVHHLKMWMHSLQELCH